MICPKCKSSIPEKSLKCTHCGVRLASFCKKCNAYNSIYNLNCSNCNNQLLKICPSCKSVNLPESLNCRKCDFDFSTQDNCIEEVVEAKSSIEEDIQEEVSAEGYETINLNYSPNIFSQQRAKEVLVEGLLSDKKRIISISAENGLGKSLVVKTAVNELKDEEFTLLLGECTAITKISPCGLIQDMLLTFFNITTFCADNLRLKKESQRFFQSEFPSLTNDEIFNLLNFLYPSAHDYYENLYLNKEKTFTFLRKVFKTIIENSKTVFIIDNFDMVDGMSYEFINLLLVENFSSSNFKILMTYNNPRPARGYLYNIAIKDSADLDISLSLFEKSQMKTFIEQYFSEEECPGKLKEKIYRLSEGNPAKLEQIVSLVVDYKNKSESFDIKIPSKIDDVLQMRLGYLKENPDLYKILALAIIQGVKFYPSIINEIMNIDESIFVQHLQYLQKLNFIVQVNDFSYSFKNSILWTSLFEIVKADENFEAYNNELYSVYSNYTLSSNSLLAVVSQNLNQDLVTLDIWTKNIKLAAFIGDVNLYIISQKQCLALVDKYDSINSSLIRNNIFERLGKLLSKINPQEAMHYLPNALANAKKQENPLKEIELAGYIASCCWDLNDFYGVIECIDVTIEKLDVEFELEIAMLKSRKIDAILSIGNCGEAINLIDNEIMPILDKNIGVKPHMNIPIKLLYKAWLKMHLSLANALVMQGNNRAFEVLSVLFELFDKNEFEDELFICKAKLALAAANTMKGDLISSEELLEETIRKYKTDVMDSDAILRWNLINITNNFIQRNYLSLKEELFQVVSYANNVGDEFTKNILRTLLGKILKDEEQAKHALDIYGEQLTYFAKEKSAIGALLSWYLIADAQLITHGPEKSLEVSQKALEVAQNPKINNYIFMVLFHKVIADAFITKSDYDSAKIHLEKAIMIAKKFEMYDLLARLYHMYGKYLQDLALVNTESQIEYVSKAINIYKKASVLAQGLKNSYILSEIEKSKAVLNSFCQLNGIVLKEQ